MSEQLTAEWSPSIGKITAALIEAQKELDGVAKDSTNPHFKTDYASLLAVWKEAKGPLNKNGIAVVQIPSVHGSDQVLITVLAHGSGEWFKGTYKCTPVKADPQGMGSAVTYARRYSLMAMTGLAPEDDDGNAASQDKWSELERGVAKSKPVEQALKDSINEQLAKLGPPPDTVSFVPKQIAALSPKLKNMSGVLFSGMTTEQLEVVTGEMRDLLRTGKGNAAKDYVTAIGTTTKQLIEARSKVEGVIK